MSVADSLVLGRVRTLDDDRPTAEAVAIRDGVVAGVGTVAELESLRGPATVVHDLGDAVVQPGFVDVHNHHALAGRTALFELSFSVSLTLDQVLDAVAAHAVTLPADAWVVGGSLASTLQPALRSSEVRRRLDAAAGGRPVMLMEDSRHNRWASTRALQLAGLWDADEYSEHAPRDPVGGELTGVLLEAAGIAVEQAATAAGGLSAEQHREASRHGIAELARRGVTAFQDAAVSVEILRALSELDRAGELDAWVVSSLTINDEIFGYAVVGEELLAAGEEFRTAHHRPDFVKIFLDGVPPARTASFLGPYLPDEVHGADYRGSTTMSATELTGWLRAVAARQLGAKVHCTGDGSARLLLDVVETLHEQGVTLPVQIAHGQYLGPGDVERMAALGVSADISPFLWFPGVIPDALAAVLGAERAHHLQPNRTLLDAGVLVAGGSDWPVSESPNPLEAIQGLVTRADPLGRAPGTLWPEQAVTAAEAVRICSRDSARAIGLGDVTGVLRPGMSADLVVLSADLTEIDPTTIIDTRVLQTWVRGEPVFVA